MNNIFKHILLLAFTSFYAAEVFIGIRFLHTKGIIYRDLKLDNIMLDLEGHVKITDFGMCKDGMGEDGVTQTFCGTPDYIAPEMIRGRKYGYSVDWWSFGVLVFEMLVGEAPFDGDDEDQLFSAIIETQPNYPKTLSKEAVSLVKNLLAKEPEGRLGCGPRKSLEVKEHSFFNRLDWDKLETRHVQPPFRPPVKSNRDAQNFDAEFTTMPTDMSPCDKLFIMNLTQQEFAGFSFVNPEYVVEV